MQINQEIILKKKKELDCNYEVLAIKADISTYAMWSLCNTKGYNAKLETVQKVADFLGIELTELLSEEGKKEYKLEKEW